MARFKPDWLPLAMGSMPHTSPAAAWEVVQRYFGAIPCWPQLPRRTPLENMYVQFSERFPGVRLENDRNYVERDLHLNEGLEALYLAYLENDLTHAAISAPYASALAALRQGQLTLPPHLVGLKGQVTGPISWGLTVVDESQRPILYDQVLADAVSKHLRLKAAWQEQELKRLAPTTILFIDEPYMTSLGSSFVPLDREQAVGLLEEVLAGLSGITGIHCCGSTEWPVVLNTSVDIVSFDAFDYGHTLALYPEEVNRFLARGGVIAWGISPAGIAAENETVETLVQRLHDAIGRLEERGVERDAILRAGLVMPSCSVGSLPPTLAEHVFALTAGVSAEMRRRYVEQRSTEPVS